MTANLRMVSTPSISITGSSLSSVSPPAPPQQITASVFHPYRLPPARPGNHPVKGRLAAPWTKVSSRPLLVPVNTENRTSCSQSVSQSVHRWYALSGRQIEVLSCRADATHYARYNEMSSVIEGDTELHFQWGHNKLPRQAFASWPHKVYSPIITDSPANSVTVANPIMKPPEITNCCVAPFYFYAYFCH